MPDPGADGAAGEGAADDNHRHLPHDLEQVVEDVGDVQLGKTLAQQPGGLPFGLVEGRLHGPDPVQVEGQRGDRFVEVGAVMGASLIAHLIGDA